MDEENEDSRLDYLMDSARKYAENGMVEEALRYISYIKGRYFEVTPPALENELNRIEELAYRKKMDYLLGRVGSYIRSGNVELALEYIEDIKKYKDMSNSDIPNEKLSEIEMQAYIKGMENAVNNAKWYLERGMNGSALVELLKAKEYAEKSGAKAATETLRDLDNLLGLEGVVTSQKMGYYYSLCASYLDSHYLLQMVENLYSTLREE